MADHEPMRIIMTEQDGTVTVLPIRGQINRGPENGQQQITTVGATERRGDSRTPEVIFTDQVQMGEWEYEEINGVQGFTDSSCDTRYGMITLPPLPTQLGGAVGLNTSAPAYVAAPGLSAAEIIPWVPLTGSGVSAARWDAGGSAWAAIQVGGSNITNLTGYTEFRGAYYFTTTNNTVGYYTSTNATAWSAGARAKALYGCCVHDNKVYVFNGTDSTLDWTIDFSAWSSSAALYLYPGEFVRQVYEWQVGGRALVFVLTNRRDLWYDEDADTFHDYFRFDDLTTAANVWPRVEVWRRDENKYLTLYDTTGTNLPDTVYWFAGTINQATPNRLGALPATGVVSLLSLAGSSLWLYAFGGPRRSGKGRILAMNEQQGFTAIWDAPGGSEGLYGGTYARGNLYALTFDGSTTRCYKIPVPDNRDSPLFASRTYRIDKTMYHEFAFTDLGTENLPKTALWATVTARDHTTTNKNQGMASGCSAIVSWIRDTDSAFSTLGTVDNSSTWPATLPFNNGFGVSFYQMKLRIGLASASTSNTPVITSVALACLREEWVRDRYSFVVDLSRDEHLQKWGKSRTEILAVLERVRQPGHLVTLQFAGGDEYFAPSTGRTITSAKISFSGQEDVRLGPGLYSVGAVDYSPPDFGDPVALPHS